MKKKKSFNFWRVLEPIILGFFANFLINYIFNPIDPDSSIQEYVVAVLFSILITELNRFIDIKIDAKYSWTINASKRFLYNLLYITLSLLFILNVIGNIYMWIVENSFYRWDEYLIINLVTLLIALLLTVFKWTAHFYNSWKNTVRSLDLTHQKYTELSTQIEEEEKSINLQLNSRQFKTKVSDIKMAKSESGITKVYLSNDQFHLYQGTLTRLNTLLPAQLFFQVSRDVILNRNSILSIASSSFGKISLNTNMTINRDLTVSRPKASAFRKWYNSTSDNN